MKIERSKVEFPLWRKKVDKSLFEHSGTTVPAWACQMWGLPNLFSEVSSKKNPRSNVVVVFQNKTFNGWVTFSKSSRYRLWFEDSLSIELKRSFLMSYMRALESGLEENTKRVICWARSITRFKNDC